LREAYAGLVFVSNEFGRRQRHQCGRRIVGPLLGEKRCEDRSRESRDRLVGIAGGRRLHKINKGHLGLVSENAKEGDLFFMLRGNPIPFLFRRSGGDYALKDACYVHGMTQNWVLEESGCPKQEIRNARHSTTSIVKIEYFSPDARLTVAEGDMREASHSEATKDRQLARREKFSINVPITKPQLFPHPGIRYHKP
jgi:hypothetical protein